MPDTAIVSAEAAWVSESQLQVNITYEDGSVEPVTVLVPPSPGMHPFLIGPPQGFYDESPDDEPPTDA